MSVPQLSRSCPAAGQERGYWSILVHFAALSVNLQALVISDKFNKFRYLKTRVAVPRPPRHFLLFENGKAIEPSDNTQLFSPSDFSAYGLFFGCGSQWVMSAF